MSDTLIICQRASEANTAKTLLLLPEAMAVGIFYPLCGQRFDTIVVMPMWSASEVERTILDELITDLSLHLKKGGKIINLATILDSKNEQAGSRC